MKTLIISALLVFLAFSGKAQEITQLEEAKVIVPSSVKLSTNLSELTFNVEEDYAGEFTKDPIKFMKENFDIQSVIDQTGEEYDSYVVTFLSSKGHLKADFDNDGELVRTNQKLKNIMLPLAVRNELYNSHKGWTMVSNKYVASGKSDRIDRAVYRIKLENGNKTARVKIDPMRLEGIAVANN
ncbi:hypothetical protein [Salegentibacter chungangensis]|uniref:Nicotinate-nucleotide adenylyltransferase n=1 Tax=Salegentibacter chungangensis TaxID=1335724 RepID=A0ABW3NVY3_9FLAO